MLRVFGKVEDCSGESAQILRWGLPLNPVSLVLLIHSHQPVGNFDHVVEEAYQNSYRPFAETLEAHPKIRLSLHYSGVLLEWIEKHHPEFFDLLKRLVGKSQAELVGGGFYEPILPAIPDADKVDQIKMLGDYLKHHFGERPRGAWVAERVWEPSLARPLAEAGVDYVVLDDTHFLAAGLQPHELHGAYITEEVGAPLRLVPSLQILRYTIPFRDPEETMSVLREGVNLPSRLFASGDDCEKFGVWPGTHDHCYTNGWLERFLRGIENSAEWLETSTVGAYLESHAPVGRVYLPTASYAEMMEWALPPQAAQDFKSCLDESNRMASGDRFRRFLRGGLWQNFLAKYSESNQLHKFMLDLSRRWRLASRGKRSGKDAKRLLAEAHEHLMAGQCNDPYWHGIFGGLYAPHLRSAVERHLIQAETLLDQLNPVRSNPGLAVETRDFDLDGQPEVLAGHPTFGMVLRPSDGGTVSSLRFKPANVELINSLMRRPEAYHEQVRQKVSTHDSSGAGPASIHDRVWSKESNLSALLRYDRYGRHAFRTYLFPASKQFEDFNYLRLEENLEVAGGAWALAHRRGADGEVFELSKEIRVTSNGQEQPVRATKEIETSAEDGVWRLECRSSLAAEHEIPASLTLGVEAVFNLLAPDAPDRYIQANQARWPLEFQGEVDASELLLVDEWQGLQISLSGYPRPLWWIAPVETISQSESGFERVYQGSAILAVWRISPPRWRNAVCALSVKITQLG
jgi:4-alpha-glucanotransferase